ncbi:MAG: NmrA family NAD(P)-binding protein [Oryzomonas sp.]|uniref:NmrA family NAD(P)-binding protein n=1 Tax=Oryzomonas sp. TaxID=2855186 RepID=UPI0028407492|nr:NmrA family NAD(P)-binding protein [Oryzomonas sp.]MDR3580337.1 NmrA family NAD(P)-binding protein [Oryzomonas sp.]
MYVITGATGNIGSKAANILLEKGEKVRVIGRSADRLRQFVNKGAEAAVGSLKDSAFVTRAFKGADAVFAMIPPDHTATDFRAYQNEVGTSLAAAITKAGVRHVVNLSSQGADRPAGTGPILGLHDQEQRLDRLQGVNVVHVRPTYFMENLLANIPLINRQGIAGSAIRGDVKFAMIATRDIAANVAVQLVNKGFKGTSAWDLLGERDLSLNEAIAVIGREIGKPDLKYMQFSYEDAAKSMQEMGLSPDMSRLINEMCKAVNGGLLGTGRQRTPENTTPTSIEEFALVFAEIFAASTWRQAA